MWVVSWSHVFVFIVMLKLNDYSIHWQQHITTAGIAANNDSKRQPAVVKHSQPGDCMLITLGVWLAAWPTEAPVDDIGRRRPFTVRAALGLVTSLVELTARCEGWRHASSIPSSTTTSNQSRQQLAASCCYFLFADAPRRIFFTRELLT